MTYIDNLRDIFNYITDRARNIALVIIGGWPEVIAETKLSLVEVVNAVRTLIHCSGQDIKLAVGINSRIEPQLVQEIRRMPIDYIWPGGTEYTIDDKIETMQAILRGEPFVHPKLERLLRPRRLGAKKLTSDLTPRQQQILDIVAQRGVSNKQIARMLNISESTVKLHMSGILKKFGVRNRTQLALFERDKAKA
jgi:DNA-binding NarL/FixJ family response regulator